MKNQTLFSLKDKSKKLKCGLLQFLFGALRVKLFYSEKICNFFFLSNFMKQEVRSCKYKQ